MNLQSAIRKGRALVGVLLTVAASAVAGCGTGATARGDWESEFHGTLSPDCDNLDHLGYGMHYDIVLTQRPVTSREAAGAVPPLRVHRESRQE